MNEYIDFGRISYTAYERLASAERGKSPWPWDLLVDHKRNKFAAAERAACNNALERAAALLDTMVADQYTTRRIAEDGGISVRTAYRVGEDAAALVRSLIVREPDRSPPHQRRPGDPRRPGAPETAMIK